jgi:hypothetical protein
MENQQIAKNSSGLMFAHFQARAALYNLELVHKNLSELSANLNNDDPQQALILKEVSEASDIIMDMRKILQFGCNTIYKKCIEAIQSRL